MTARRTMMRQALTAAEQNAAPAVHRTASHHTTPCHAPRSMKRRAYPRHAMPRRTAPRYTRPHRATPFLAAHAGCLAVASTPDNARTYSSVNTTNAATASSMLNSAQAWSASQNSAGQWLQLDLGSARAVRGTVVQPHDSNAEWVSRYTVKHRSVDSTWTEVPEKHAWRRVPANFSGVGTTDTEGIFPAVVIARYVRLIVAAWSGHISMRVDVLLSCGTHPYIASRSAARHFCTAACRATPTRRSPHYRSSKKVPGRLLGRQQRSMRRMPPR